MTGYRRAQDSILHVTLRLKGVYRPACRQPDYVLCGGNEKMRIFEESVEIEDSIIAFSSGGVPFVRCASRQGRIPADHGYYGLRPARSATR